MSIRGRIGIVFAILCAFDVLTVVAESKFELAAPRHPATVHIRFSVALISRPASGTLDIG
jgi:hypothetical protein